MVVAVVVAVAGVVVDVRVGLVRVVIVVNRKSVANSKNREK